MTSPVNPQMAASSAGPSKILLTDEAPANLPCQNCHAPKPSLPWTDEDLMAIVATQPYAVAAGAPAAGVASSSAHDTSNAFGPVHMNYHYFRIGLLIHDTQVTDRSLIAAMENPISTCRVVALVNLNPTRPNHQSSATATVPLVNEDWQIQSEQDCRRWLERYGVRNHTADYVKIYFGQEGYEAFLQSSEVDAVYINVPTEMHRACTIRALQLHKHVLLQDPISTSLDDFTQQMQVARVANRFIQFPTMFLFHHQVMIFLEQVLYYKFGTIESIDARLVLNYMDLHKVGVSLKSSLLPGQGCIRRLGRYCVLVGVMMMARTGSRAVAVRCIKASTQRNDGVSEGQYKTNNISNQGTGARDSSIHGGQPRPEPISADCLIRFSDNQIFTFHVGYSSSPTRQVLEVRAHDRYATMTDFVLHHPDGLATLRMYDKSLNINTGKLDVVGGEAFDIPSGPPQEVMMWRRFTRICQAVEEQGWNCHQERSSARSDESSSTGIAAVSEAKEMAMVAFQTKRILIALTKSYEGGFCEVPVINSDDEQGLMLI